jgi:hypothetical protein
MFTPFAFVKSATVPVTPFSGILDSYPSASGAWSAARRLSSTYTGSILTVRRASDNTTQTIGYTVNGDLDTTSLSSFCAGTTGYVTTLYDQSGNGVNLTQAADARQPLIYGSGSVITKGSNNETSMYFDGIQTHLSGAYATSSNSYMSAFAVAAPFDTGSNWCIYAQSLNSTQPPAFGLIDRDIFLDFMWGSGQEASYTPNTTNLATRAGIRKSSSTQNTVYLNGTAGSTTTTATDVTIGPIVTLGCIFGATNGGDGTFPYKGWISEMIVWRTDQTSNVSGIDTDMGNYYGI